MQESKAEELIRRPKEPSRVNARYRISRSAAAAAAATIIPRELNLPISDAERGGSNSGGSSSAVENGANTEAASGVNGRKMNYRLYVVRANLHWRWARPGPARPDSAQLGVCCKLVARVRPSVPVPLRARLRSGPTLHLGTGHKRCPLSQPRVYLS